MRILGLSTKLSKSAFAIGGIFSLVLCILAIYFVKDVNLSGDETYYFRSSRHFINMVSAAFQGDWTQVSSLWSKIVGRGWFIPTLSLLLSPVSIFSHEIQVYRIVLFLINSFLFLLSIRLFLKNFGWKTALLFLLVGCLFPSYLMLSFTFWGESIAGRCVLVFILLAHDYLLHDKLNTRKQVVLAALGCFIAFLRPSYLFLLPTFVLMVLFLHYERLSDWKLAIQKTFIFGLVLSTIFIIGLAPWSYSVSKKYGHFIPTTMTTNFRFVGFMDAIYTAKVIDSHDGPKAKKMRWGIIHNYYLDHSGGDFSRYYDLVEADRIALFDRLPNREYWKFVEAHLRRVGTDPNFLVSRFQDLLDDKFADMVKKGEFDRQAEAKIGRMHVYFNLILPLNKWIWWTLLALNFIFLFLVVDTKKLKLIGLFSKLCILVMCIQPFIAHANPRHGMGLLSLLLFNVVLMATHWNSLKFVFRVNRESWILDTLHLFVVGVYLVIMTMVLIF